MPPKSVTLEEEGAAIKSFKIVRHGQFQEQGITDLLMEPASALRILSAGECERKETTSQRVCVLFVGVSEENEETQREREREDTRER